MRTIADWCFTAATLVAADRRVMRRDWCPRWAWGARAHMAELLYSVSRRVARSDPAGWLDRPFAEPGLAVLIVALGAVLQVVL